MVWWVDENVFASEDRESRGYKVISGKREIKNKLSFSRVEEFTSRKCSLLRVVPDYIDFRFCGLTTQVTILNSDQTSRQNLSFAFPVLVKLFWRASDADGKRLLLVHCVELSLVASFPLLFWSCSNLEFLRLLLFPFINNRAAASSICTKVKGFSYSRIRKTGERHTRYCQKGKPIIVSVVVLLNIIIIKEIFLKKRCKFSFEAESEIKWSGIFFVVLVVVTPQSCRHHTNPFPVRFSPLLSLSFSSIHFTREKVPFFCSRQSFSVCYIHKREYHEDMSYIHSCIKLNIKKRRSGSGCKIFLWRNS